MFTYMCERVQDTIHICLGVPEAAGALPAEHVRACRARRRRRHGGLSMDRPRGLFCTLPSGSEAGSYLRLIDSCITQLKAREPSRTCNESKEEEKKTVRVTPPGILRRAYLTLCLRRAYLSRPLPREEGTTSNVLRTFT